MKKSVYSSFLLLFFSLAVVISYQNCGEVGGTSPFNTDLDPDDGDDGTSGLDSPSLLRLTSSTPTVSGNTLSVQFNCDYTPFSYSNHVVNIQVTGDDNYRVAWSTLCTSTSFVVTRSLPGFNPSKTYMFTARLAGITSSGEQVSSSLATINPIAIGQGVIFPPTIDFAGTWTNLNTLSGGNSQDVQLLGNVSGNSAAYIGVTGKIEFTVSSVMPIHTDNTYYGLLEFLPYEDNGAMVPEFAMSVTHRRPDTTRPAYYEALYYPSGVQQVASTSLFLASGVYVINFQFRKSDGYYYIYVYNKNNNAIALLSKNGNINFLPTFGTRSMQLKWGKNSVSNMAYSGFTNAKLKYRVCGYNSNGFQDSACLAVIPD
jgi:hypothetical protein